MKPTVKMSLTFFALLFAGCAISSPEPKICDTNGKCLSQNAFVVGTYKATLACADCSGIDAILVLTEDKKFNLEYAYQTSDNEKEQQSGVYEIKNDILTTTNLYKEQQKFKIKNNELIPLDSNEESLDNMQNSKNSYKRVK
ncbi:MULTISPECIES: copper resistance protein NlpE N-terminal domain-containing protein [unclassified Campylobacter]|uniref:copper resistance protein NlpE N-terminal domain-containing protein n=1 Tax=unclassified Campylobacter TaxID=2593542 RepID=UPI003D333D7C